MSMTIDEFKAMIATADPLETIADETTIRAELEAWFERYFGIGKVGHITPGIVAFRSDDDYDITYEEVTADVDGLPLHPTQYLEIGREVTIDGLLFRAVLYTTMDGLPRDESESAQGISVYCLADLEGKLI